MIEALTYENGPGIFARRTTVGYIAWLMPAVCLALVDSTHAGATRLEDAVPNDAVAAYFAERPTSTDGAGASWSPLKLAAFLADRANQAGLLSQLDATSRQWIDVAGSVAVLFDFPHAVTLLDVRAKANGDDGHSLASLSAAMIIQTQGNNARVAARIQHLLGAHTNTEHAKLSEQSAHGASWFSLRDSRLAEWAVISWGAIGDFYLVTIGDGAFEKIAATLLEPRQSLARDPWFDRAAHRPDTLAASHRPRVRMRSGHTGPVPSASSRNAIDASYVWYVHFDRVRASGDPRFDAKVQWIQFSLGLSGVERALWMAGQTSDSGSVEVVGVHHYDGEDALHLLAGEFAGDLLPRDAVPRSATGFAVIDCDPTDVWTGISNAYLRSRSRGAQESCSGAFDQIEADAGVSVERDIIPMLKGPVVIHNYPQHALRLPLAWTLQVPIRGESEVLRNRVDRILRAVQKTLVASDGGVLRRNDDKVWHYQYGLAGPALAITDRWMIVSFSPHAVRQNLALARTQTNSP